MPSYCARNTSFAPSINQFFPLARVLANLGPPAVRYFRYTVRSDTKPALGFTSPSQRFAKHPELGTISTWSSELLHKAQIPGGAGTNQT
jgi:hypothetical protein